LKRDELQAQFTGADPQLFDESFGLLATVEIWAVARLHDIGRQIVTDLVAVRDSADSAQAELPRRSEYYS